MGHRRRNLTFTPGLGCGDVEVRRAIVVSLSGKHGQVLVRIPSKGDSPDRLAARMIEKLRTDRF